METATSSSFVPITVELFPEHRVSGEDQVEEENNETQNEPFIVTSREEDEQTADILIENEEDANCQETVDNYTAILFHTLLENRNNVNLDQSCVQHMNTIPSNSDKELEEMWEEYHEIERSENENLSEGWFNDELVENCISEEFIEIDEILQLPSTSLQFNNYDNKDPRATECASDEKDDDQEPLYKDSTVTLGSIMVLLALFVIKHDISGKAIEQILSILAFALPASNVLPRTISKFKKYFCKLKNSFVIHKYCTFCLAYIGQSDNKHCTNKQCLKNLEEKGAISYFIEVPLIQQLQTMFSRTGFYDDLQHRFKRKKKKENAIEDIYDGRLYKSLEKKGILQSRNDISFVFNTDGVPVFKSSKVSIWPIFLIINELPYRKRMSTENMLFTGLWFGEKKPAMWTFLKPMYKALCDLEQGVELKIKDKMVRCRAVLLAASFDLPARCLVCNAMQYNGASSCWKCLQTGESAKVGKGSTWVFPFQEQNPKGPKRIHKETLEHAQQALRNQVSSKKDYIVNGIKGLSWLGLLNHFDYVAGIGIDYMHGILLGVQKTLLKLWFSSSFSKKKFNIRQYVDRVDKRLVEIAPTLEITRMPRSISEHLKYWKANELRSFLLYFGVPALYGILPDEYFQHYMLLVQAIFLLLKESISEDDINLAEQLLNVFCKKMSLLYENSYMTLNFHQLLHLADDVRDLGPLYTHSLFGFEDKNGFILKLIHGTQFIENQIVTAVSFVQKNP